MPRRRINGWNSTALEHWTEYYTDYGVNLQKKFFGHFLKGEDTGWKDQPPVLDAGAASGWKL